MASYKVPQDVEADDKLLGPFTFRQFIYLMIVFGGLALAVMLFQIFPLLAIIPIPFVIFFTILALPIKKDQPMETYLAALVSFYLKPNKRFWMPGQSESTIQITAPKKVEAPRARNITGEEAGHRLSFLANIIDSEGYAIKSANNPMRDEFYAEASNTSDMFEQAETARLNHLITKEESERHAEAVNQMRAAIASTQHEQMQAKSQSPLSQRTIQPLSSINQTQQPTQAPILPTVPNLSAPSINPDAKFNSPVVIQPDLTMDTKKHFDSLAYNPDLSVQTIQEQADRIRKENDNEVYVSLH